MAARARESTSAVEKETQQHNRDENLTSEEYFVSTPKNPDYSGLDDILKRWNYAVTVYHSKHPNLQTSLAVSRKEHHRLTIAIGAAPLIPEDIATTIFKYLLYNIGLIESFQGDYQTAVKHFQKSISLDYEFVISFYGLGVAYYQLGDYFKSARSFRSILAIMASHGVDHWDTALNVNVLERGEVSSQTQHTAGYPTAHSQPSGKVSRTGTLKRIKNWCLHKTNIADLEEQALEAQWITEDAKNACVASSSNPLSRNADAITSINPMLGVSPTNGTEKEDNEIEYLEITNSSDPWTLIPLTDVSGKGKMKGNDEDAAESEGLRKTKSKIDGGITYIDRMASFLPANLKGKDKAKGKSAEEFSSVDPIKKTIKPLKGIQAGNIAAPAHNGPVSAYADLHFFVKNAATKDAASYSSGVGYHQAISDINYSPAINSPDGPVFSAQRPKAFVPKNFLETTTLSGGVAFEGQSTYHDVITGLTARREATAKLSANSSPQINGYQTPIREVNDDDQMYHDVMKSLTTPGVNFPVLASYSPTFESSASALGISIPTPAPDSPTWETLVPASEVNVANTASSVPSWESPPRQFYVNLPTSFIASLKSPAPAPSASVPIPASNPQKLKTFGPEVNVRHPASYIPMESSARNVNVPTPASNYPAWASFMGNNPSPTPTPTYLPAWQSSARELPAPKSYLNEWATAARREANGPAPKSYLSEWASFARREDNIPTPASNYPASGSVKPVTRTSPPHSPSPTKPPPALPNFRWLEPLTPPGWVPPPGLEVLQPIVYVDPYRTPTYGVPAPAVQSPAEPLVGLPRESVNVQDLLPVLTEAVADAEEIERELKQKNRKIRTDMKTKIEAATARRRLALGLPEFESDEETVKAASGSTSRVPIPEVRVSQWREDEDEVVAGPSTAPLVAGSGFSPVASKPRARTDAVAPYHQPGEWVPHDPTRSVTGEILDLYFRPGDDVFETPVEEDEEDYDL